MRDRVNFALVIGVALIIFIIFATISNTLKELSLTVLNLASLVSSLENDVGFPPFRKVSSEQNFLISGDEEGKICPVVHGCTPGPIIGVGGGPDIVTAALNALLNCQANVQSAIATCQNLLTIEETECERSGCLYAATLNSTPGSNGCGIPTDCQESGGGVVFVPSGGGVVIVPGDQVVSSSAYITCISVWDSPPSISALCEPPIVILEPSNP
jgi:hypothetical protein